MLTPLPPRLEALYRRSLVAVDSPVLAARYNRCLGEMGLRPTELNRFSLDGLGWSPEIAAEQADPHYLAHGEANPFAIILTPEQGEKPALAPFFSFLPTVVAQIHHHYATEVEELTRETAVWLDFEEGLRSYRSPLDLLLIDSVLVRAYAASGLIAAARQQRELVAEFLGDGDAWADPDLRSRLIGSAAGVGDLRRRNLVLPDVPFGGVASFHTRAFGGVYVFREEAGRAGELLVLADQARYEALVEQGEPVFWLGSPDLLEILESRGLVTLAPGFYVERPELLARVTEGLLVDALAAARPDLEYVALNSAQRKRAAREVEDRLPEVFFELERYGRFIARHGVSTPESCGPELYRRLMHPPQGLPELTRRVVWRLISELVPDDRRLCYAWRPQEFFRAAPALTPGQSGWFLESLDTVPLPDC